MNKIKSQNPEANWGNLVVGVVILVLIAMFSVNYFDQPYTEYTDFNDLFEEVTGTDATQEEGNIVEVQPGEGLWQVAEKYCGDGEYYDEIAAANGITVSNLEIGQKLIVECN